MVDQIVFDDFSIEVKEKWTSYTRKLRGIDEMIQFFKEEYNSWSSVSNQLQPIDNYVRLSSNINDRLEKLKANPPGQNETIRILKSIEEDVFNKEMCLSHSRLGKMWISEFAKSTQQGKNFTNAVNGEALPQSFGDIVSYFRALLALEYANDIKEIFSNEKDQINNKLTVLNSSLDSSEQLLKKYETSLLALKESYETKLHLQEPIKLWEKRKFWLSISGLFWLLLLVSTIAIFIFLAKNFLYDPPEIIKSIKSFFEPNAIKFFLIILTCVSFVGFLITVLAKFIFSTFHLMRDAEERKVLTDFYLSMLMRGNVTDGERSLIIQALFSRADTGLLKGDSSPAMPNSILEKLVEALKK